MNPIMFLFVLVSSLVAQPLLVVAQPPNPTSHITVVGAVYCDTCYDNTFSNQSYFLPGVDVHVQCIFKANSPKTTEQIAFSVNRTTNRYGAYELEIPSVEGVDCVEDPAIQSFCESSLIQSPYSTCNVPGLRSTTDEITVKSKQTNLCIYSLSALSFRPQQRNITLCGKRTEEEEELPFSTSLNSSKFLLPYNFPWPPLPQLPPLPPLPPLPQLPPFPKLPFPFPPLPPLPPSLLSPPPRPPPPPPAFNFPKFPFPPLPPLHFPFPPFPPSPPPPAFNLRDPRTWIPNNPFLSPPPPPAFNLRDPRTWIPNNPLLTPPPPSAFNLRDPRTWIPHIPPTPPTIPQNQQP